MSHQGTNRLPDHGPKAKLARSAPLGARPPVIAEGLHSYQFGGSERVGAELAMQFRARGYEVICFALYGSDGPFRTTLERDGIRCVDLNYVSRLRPVRRLTFQAEVWRFLRRERVAALHLHHANALIHCGLAARLARVPRVTMTEHAIFQLQEHPAYKRQVTRYLRFADDITLVAPGQVEYFHEQMGIGRERLHCIPNGVRIRNRDAAAAAAVRRELAIAEQSFVFLYAGRLSEVKSLPVLLQAIALLPAEVRRSMVLVIAGDGPERAALERLRVELDIAGSVLFIGPRSDVDALLSAADAFVMSSRTEGLPMSLLEAMSSGVPCVATAVGGISDLLGGGAGLTVPAGSSQQLAAAMSALIADPELRLRIAATALARMARDYSMDAVVDRYLGLLGLPARWDAKPRFRH